MHRRNRVMRAAGLALAMGMVWLVASETYATPEETGCHTDTADDATQDLTAESLLAAIEAAAEDLATLRCRLRYTRIQGLLADEQQRFGTFYYTASNDEQSAQFAVHLDRLVMDDRLRPIDQWLVYDGRWLLERNAIDMTATRREVRSESDAAEPSDTLALDDQSIPIPLRLKKDEVLRDYDAQRLNDQPMGDWILYHLRLTPKPNGEPNQNRTPLDLWFDSETLLLTKVVTTEGEDEIELVFAPSAMEPNAEIKPETFRTALPDAADGWEVQDIPLP